MTPVEWTAVKDHVTALWGKTRKWANYGHLINQVGHVTYEDAIRVVERHVISGRFIPSPADIIAIKPSDTVTLVPAMAFVPADCGDHRLEVVEGPYGPPHRVCRNTGCDYQTSGAHDG